MQIRNATPRKADSFLFNLASSNELRARAKCFAFAGFPKRYKRLERPTSDKWK